MMTSTLFVEVSVKENSLRDFVVFEQEVLENFDNVRKFEEK
jgi:hypothetical protein